MAITYPMAWPTITALARGKIVSRSVVGMNEAPHSRKQTLQQYSGDGWEAMITLPQLKRFEAAAWIAFLVALKGVWGTFLFGDPAAATPRGSASSAPGTPVVKGASQTGDTLAIDGAPASAAGYLLQYDYIQLGAAAGAQLYMVLEDASADGSGNVTLSIWPPLRSSPADNAAVVVSGARGLFRLAENKRGWDEARIMFGASFRIVEAR